MRSKFLTFQSDRRAFAPADEGTGGDGGAGDPPGGGAGEGAGGDGGAGGGDWWADTRLTDDDRLTLEASGLKGVDPIDAITKLTGMERAAQKKLGGKVDQLISKPAKDQARGDWMRANAELFGIPETPEGYEVTRPEGFEEDATWNTALEAEARAIAHKHGADSAMVQDMVNLYAGQIKAMNDQVEAAFTESAEAMTTQLKADWGDNYEANMTRAKQALAHVVEQGEFTDAERDQFMGAFAKEIGDAGVAKFLATIGGLMGEDRFADDPGAGSAGMKMSAADAGAKLAEMTKPGSEYYDAVQKRDQAAIKRLAPQIDQLTRIAAGGK